jgi:hypothetical protein
MTARSGAAQALRRDRSGRSGRCSWPCGRRCWHAAEATPPTAHTTVAHHGRARTTSLATVTSASAGSPRTTCVLAFAPARRTAASASWTVASTCESGNGCHTLAAPVGAPEIRVQPAQSRGLHARGVHERTVQGSAQPPRLQGSDQPPTPVPLMRADPVPPSPSEQRDLGREMDAHTPIGPLTPASKTPE